MPATSFEELAHNGLASGAAKSAEVPLSFGAALGGLCASFGFAHNGLASGAANSAEVRLSFGAALGGLCASFGFAQNGVRRGLVSGSFGGARRTLCASESVAGNEGAGEPIFAASSCGHTLLRASQRSTESVVGVAGVWAAVSICVTSVTGVARARGDSARWVVDVVG